MVARPRRGEVWWARLPDFGRRPALVLTRDASIPLLNRLMVVPATRTVREIPTVVHLTPDDGMPADCVLTLDNVMLVPKSGFDAFITRLSAQRMAEVCDALQVAVGCGYRPRPPSA